ncbi:unnamed protein product [Pocillopora meandrina]|uniref:Ion transport domain-containing protein n=1 Tax=Pocillopora meandrina TaxID=46732 RepID=A0AAU9XUG6_9CNID|nr:unnamed protein product [Pocillopora meandrina]
MRQNLVFLDVAKTLVKKCPLFLGLRTAEQVEPEKIRRLLPAEVALVADNDEMAAYLIRMMWHESVQRLFSWKPDDMRKPQPSFFNLHSIIENPKMKKTVVALLDQMVIPHWPYLPQRKDTYDTDEEEEGIEGAWSTITDDPLSYHFYYHILDGGEGGRPPKIIESVEDKQIDNKYFSLKDKSCLHLIAKSKNMEALQHPVVRMLIKTKWNSYGFVFLCLQAAFYVIFLLFLSYSLIHGSTRTDPTQYRGVTDFLRGFCEVVTLAMAVFYICEEFNQMRVWLSILLMMAYMGTVTVILLNILIAQMSTTFTQAKNVARLEYDVDRILQLTRMERFPFLNLRVKYYKEGDWISEMKLAQELLEFSEDRNS